MGSVPRIQTQCKAIDTLTDGGLATGTITQIFGEKALGKIIISFQTGVRRCRERDRAPSYSTRSSPTRATSSRTGRRG